MHLTVNQAPYPGTNQTTRRPAGHRADTALLGDAVEATATGPCSAAPIPRPSPVEVTGSDVSPGRRGFALRMSAAPARDPRCPAGRSSPGCSFHVDRGHHHPRRAARHPSAQGGRIVRWLGSAATSCGSRGPHAGRPRRHQRGREPAPELAAVLPQGTATVLARSPATAILKIDRLPVRALLPGTCSGRSGTGSRPTCSTSPGADHDPSRTAPRARAPDADGTARLYERVVVYLDGQLQEVLGAGRYGLNQEGRSVVLVRVARAGAPDRRSGCRHPPTR